MTPVDPVLNEPSFSPHALDRHQARLRMGELIGILARFPQYGLGTGLRVSNELYTLELSQGYSLNDWINDRDVDRNHLSFFLGLAAKGPYLRALDTQALECLEDTEVTFLGFSHPAYLASYALNAPLVSFSHEVWAKPEFIATATRLNGEGELDDEEISLLNFSHVQHFDYHADWLSKRSIVESASDLWARRLELFPHLDFAESVEQELVGQESILNLIVARLLDIETNAASGRPFNKDMFAFRCHATSTATFNMFGSEYDFLMPNGSRERCGWHFYLPDGRRIYFSNTYAIGHVGSHLPTVRFH